MDLDLALEVAQALDRSDQDLAQLDLDLVAMAVDLDLVATVVDLDQSDQALDLAQSVQILAQSVQEVDRLVQALALDRSDPGLAQLAQQDPARLVQLDQSALALESSRSRWLLMSRS